MSALQDRKSRALAQKIRIFWISRWQQKPDMGALSDVPGTVQCSGRARQQELATFSHKDHPNSVLTPASLYITFSAAIHNKPHILHSTDVVSIVSLLKGLPAVRMSTVIKLDVAFIRRQLQKCGCKRKQLFVFIILTSGTLQMRDRAVCRQ